MLYCACTLWFQNFQINFHTLNTCTEIAVTSCPLFSETEMIVLGGFGGAGRDEGYLTTVEQYDSDGSSIKTLQSMTIAR